MHYIYGSSYSPENHRRSSPFEFSSEEHLTQKKSAEAQSSEIMVERSRRYLSNVLFVSQESMSPTTNMDFGVEIETMKKIVPLGRVFFCILFNYTILKDTKNVLVVTANGSNAKTILFLNLKTQIESLEKNFDTGNKLESYRKIQPAKRQVAIRFQNRRARLKTKQLEMDYQTLKQNYDHLKTNHDNLYEEKKKLRTEIRLNRKFELEHAEVRSKRKIPWFRGFLEENTDFW